LKKRAWVSTSAVIPWTASGARLRRFANAITVNCTERGPRAEVILGGVVAEYQERVIKNGTGKYAFFKLEDQQGTIEFHVASGPSSTTIARC
jgi:DNA polymerase III alpha subunit